MPSNIISVHIHMHTGVRLILRGLQYHDNAIINIMDIGEHDSALICQTNLRPCCKISRAGEWYYPNGTAVPIEGRQQDFYRNRDDNGTVRLNRRNNANYPVGVYRCEIPGVTNTMQTLHVGLISNGHFGKFHHIWIIAEQSIQLRHM